ncbi:ATP-dependent transporter, putative [Plasmodium vivax]|uniref:ATP-dependent transporter, putative n=2 Tax=Plasmodium vivax TaxID=5855 RepID=A5KB43_PLAVS|nr:ATP-dependent transporter, putative [Plasmodium vivax]EDL43321.1 ATP-dependent transporter, putative [Plasmodium vivax]KMZ99836.1 ATP-dependent transporter [Plasmodium vivax North Korean]|eukprot:XP_001613048.1 ATP-dependent transporter [Plasmodium vivax Sal-1]
MKFVHNWILLCLVACGSSSKNAQHHREYTVRQKNAVGTPHPAKLYKKCKNKKRHFGGSLQNFTSRKRVPRRERKNDKSGAPSRGVPIRRVTSNGVPNNKALPHRGAFLHNRTLLTQGTPLPKTRFSLKRGKTSGHLGPLQLGSANEKIDPFVVPSDIQQSEINAEKGIFSSLYSKMLEKSKHKNNILNDVSKLFKVIRESKHLFFVGFLLTIISSVVDSYIPILLSKTITYVMNKSALVAQTNHMPVVNSFLSQFKLDNPFYAYVSVSLVSLLLSSMRSYIFNICAYISTNKLQNYLFRVLLHKHISYFKKRGKGELISRLSIDSSELIDIFTTNIIVLLRNVIKTALSFYFLYKINVHLFVVSLFIVLTIINISIFFSSIFRKLAKEESNVVAYSNNVVEESFENFSLINSFNTHSKEIAKFNRSLDAIHMSRMKLGLLYIIEKLLIRSIDLITFIVTLILSKKMLKGNIHVDSRTAISSVMYMQNIIAQSCTIEQQYSRVQELIGNAEDIIKLIEKDSARGNPNKFTSPKCTPLNWLNFLDLKNTIFKYSLIKKFQAIQKNAEYVATVIRPNYLKLFERNYNNLRKFLPDERCGGWKDDPGGGTPWVEAKRVESSTPGGCRDYFGNNRQVGTNRANDPTCNGFPPRDPLPEGATRDIAPNAGQTGEDPITMLKGKLHSVSPPFAAPSPTAPPPPLTTAEHTPNGGEKLTPKVKKNKPQMNMQEIYSFIKNDHELIIKHKLDKHFIHFLKTKYKKNIISLILKLFEERHHPVSEELLFMLDNIGSFKRLSMQDKKSILKMSNITNNTLYVVLLTFLFYNYSKFYYKRKKRTPVNLLEKKSKVGLAASTASGTSCGDCANDVDHVTLDGINMNDVLSDTTITEMHHDGVQNGDNNEDGAKDEASTVTSSGDKENLDDNENSDDSLTHTELNAPTQTDDAVETASNLRATECSHTSDDEILKNKKLKKKKKKNLHNILPYIVQNAIKELEILKFIDENYKHINENLILDNIKDDKKGSSLIFENVDFYYAKFPKNKILSNINLNFTNKYTYGILCYNDSGKDDLSKLCTRLYTKTYGSILLDNENIENISKYILTRKISLVEEDTYLFSDSIIYNILYSYNCRTKANKYLSYFNYTFGLNKNSINSCVHLFPSDGDLLGENNERAEKMLKGTNPPSKGDPSRAEAETTQAKYPSPPFKKCLMCGDDVNTKQLDEQKKKKKSYNKYKVHFVKKLYKEIIKVSKIVCIHDLITSYKDKFFHNINEKTLSGGQKQKISLARAIIKKPKILILDEAFSALDSANELKIFSSIKSYLPNSTIINLSHKITTIDRCDYIYVLKDGKIIEHGLRTKLKENKNSEYSKKMSEF